MIMNPSHQVPNEWKTVEMNLVSRFTPAFWSLHDCLYAHVGD